MYVGNNIRELREVRGLSQLALGEAVGLRQSTISEIERGTNQPSLDTVYKLAEYFCVEPGDLLKVPTQSTSA